MANEPKTDPSKTHVQIIPLTKIHDLPGVPTMNQPDKSYGGLVSSMWLCRKYPNSKGGTTNSGATYSI